MAGAGGVRVQRRDGLLQLRGGGVGGQLHPDGGDAHLFAVAVFHAHVVLAGRVVTDEHRRQPGHHPQGAEPTHPLLQFRLDGGGRGPAVKDPRGHSHPPAQWKK